MLVILCILLQLLPAATAAEDAWDGAAVDTQWYENNPGAVSFTITDANELAGLAKLVNDGTDSFAGKTITLGDDINLGGKEWTPIGVNGPGARFQGTFDGGEYTVSGLSVTSTSSVYMGLFGYIGGSTDGTTITFSYIINLRVEGTIDFSARTATAAAYAGGIAAYSYYARIMDCSTDITIRGSDACDSILGGIIGYGRLCVLECCTSEGIITSEGCSNCGGIVGWGIQLTISECASSCNVSGGYDSYGFGSYLGGLGGYLNNCIFSNCHATGNVTGNHEGTTAGGLLGWQISGTVSDSYATGDVFGYGIEGGFVGQNGYTGSSVIKNCYATGDVKGGTAGGFVGLNLSSINDCSASGAVTSQPYMDGNYIGGFVGQNGNTSSSANIVIEHCYATGDVHGSIAGGFVGGNLRDIDSCYASGDVTGLDYSESSKVGGFAGENGYLYFEKTSTIQGSYATGDVSGSASAGGFVGMTREYSLIINCYATGDVSESEEIGTWSYYTMGGFVDSGYGIIVNCFATGDVTGGRSAGGFANYFSKELADGFDGLLLNCYAAGIVSDTTNDDYGGFMGYPVDDVTILSCYYNSSDNAAGIGPGTDPDNTTATGVALGDMKTQEMADDLNEYVADNPIYDDTELFAWRQLDGVNDDLPYFLTSAPDAPENLTASRGNKKVTLSWNPPANADDAPVAQYVIYRDGVEVGRTERDTTTYIDTGLTNGVTYAYTVTAVNVLGESIGATASATPASVNMDTIATTPSTTTPPNNSISEEATVFDLNPDGEDNGEISVTLMPEGDATLEGIYLNGELLTEGEDYTVSGTEYIFSEDFLAGLEEGTHTITFDMSKGTDPVLTITITDTGEAPDPDPGEESPFADVKKDDWFYEGILYVWEKGIMVGTSDETFDPLLPVTRGMMATVIWRMAGEPAPSGDSGFPDLTEDWYEDAVHWGYENTIVKGYDNGNFGPDDLITREQLVTMLYRYATWLGQDTSARGDLTVYADNSDVSDWAASEMAWAVAEGLIEGRSGAQLAPEETATRGELSTILERFLEG